MLYSLAIDSSTRAQIAQLIVKAFAAPIKYADLVKLAEKYARGEACDGLNNDKTMQLPTCYQVTFTVEEHHPGKQFRHLSLSIIGGRRGAGPAPITIEMVLGEFGFQGGLANCQIDTEILQSGTIAVGAIQPVDGNWHIA